jgi:hypothetical protein
LQGPLGGESLGVDRFNFVHLDTPLSRIDELGKATDKLVIWDARDGQGLPVPHGIKRGSGAD